MDAGSVQVNSLVPMSFTNLGATGTLLINDSAGGANDRLIYNGTAASDTFTVPSGIGALPATSVRLNSQIGVGTTAVNIYTLRGLGGDDTFTVTPQTALLIEVQGDEPGSSDTLTYNAQAGQPVTVDLGLARIQQTTFGDVNFSGIETLNANANANALTVNGTGNDDTLVVTPFTATTGTLQNNGADPVVNYSAIAANTLTLAPGVGQDTVVIQGNTSTETIDVNTGSVVAGQVGASGQTIATGLAAEDALQIWADAGTDTINVAAAAYPIFVDGGDPIGVLPGDTLTLAAGGNPVTFKPGPEVG